MNIISNDFMETLSNELIVYNIGARLDRLERNIFRLTNRRYAQLIFTQKQLNDHYAEACKKDAIHVILEWRKKGALETLEEICNLAIDKRRNRKILAEKLRYSAPKRIPTIDLLSYGIRQKNILFISWILQTDNPRYYSEEIRSSLALSEQLNHHAINILLQNYISKKEYAERQPEQTQSRGYWPNYGPPAP